MKDERLRIILSFGKSLVHNLYKIYFINYRFGLDLLI